MSAISEYLLRYARFSAKCDAHYILAKKKYDPATVFATSKIDPLPYQLEDFISLLTDIESEGGLQALLSYETGLGKTIVAGLVIKEFLLRNPSSNIMVIATPMGVPQWKQELEQKFGIRNVRVESMDTLKNRLDELKETEPRWDLVVVDELHRATPGNKRYELIKWVREHSSNFLTLTATPHDGKHEHFIGRLQLINPAVNESNYREFLERHNYRRLKRKVVGLNGEPLFPYRVYSYTVDVDVSEEESEFYRAVEDYVRREYNIAFRTSNRKYGLIATVMGRIASSSVVAGISALERRKAVILKRVAERANQEELVQRIREYMEGNSDEEFEDIANDVLSLAPEASDEIEIIDHIIELGKKVRTDSKAEKLREIVDKQVSMGNKVIVFTSFVETAEHLRLLIPDSQIATGRMPPDERRENINRFLERGSVLIGTEVIGESLNLQRANVVVNYELPWSPVVFIQRVGRVYRYPMTKPVFVFSFSSALRVERRVLQVLYQKVQRLIDEFDEGSVAIIGNEISEDEIERIMQEAYVKGEEATRDLERRTAQALKHVEELKSVLELSEAGRMHVNASAILKNVSQLVTTDDIRSFLEKIRMAGLGSGDPYSEPPFFRVNGTVLKKLDVEDECVREALRVASELKPETVVLLHDRDEDAVVHEVEYLDSLGHVVAKDVVASSRKTTEPYSVIRLLEPVDMEAGEIKAEIPMDLQDRLKARIDELSSAVREKALKQAELIKSSLDMEKSTNPVFLQARKDKIESEIARLRKIASGGVSVRAGKILGYVRFVTSSTAYREIGDERYSVELEAKKRQSELAAMDYVIRYERSMGYQVEDVHEMNLGYDLISRKGNEEKFIEVKGISSGETVILTLNEYKASQKHSSKFYLYVVRDPLKNPTL
ncbi:MAG: helicase-related protein, partial [Nitrososphaeria archaeon]